MQVQIKHMYIRQWAGTAADCSRIFSLV